MTSPMLEHEREPFAEAAIAPNLFVVGAAKAGTTSLHAYLGQHPDIHMSAHKEPHFFADVRNAPNILAVRDRERYLALFVEGRDRRYRGEASPSYLWDPKAAERIRSASPEARIVIALRDPVERAHSHYLMDLREGLHRRSFQKALARDLEERETGWGISHLYHALGRYADQVERYLQVFARSRVHVLFFEHMRDDPGAALERLYAFLELPPHRPRTAPRNQFAIPRNGLASRLMGAHPLRTSLRAMLPPPVRAFVRSRLLDTRADKPEIPSDVEARLVEHYAADVERLESLLGRPVPWPRWSRP